jgi:hypothetical protein
MWFKVFMGIMLPVLAIAWIAYWLWQRKLDREEAKLTKVEKSSDRLKKTHSEVSDWAKQMANFKKPERKPSPPPSESQ